MAQWLRRLTHKSQCLSVVSLNPIKGSCCFLDLGTTLIAQYWLVPGMDAITISYAK